MLKIKYLFILVHIFSDISSSTISPHENIINTVTLYFAKLINTSISNNYYLSKSCQQTLTDLYINGTDSWYYLHKLLYDSSHNQGDTTSFDACKRKTHGINKKNQNDDLTYLMLLVDKRGINNTVFSMLTETLLYYYGFCMPKTNCTKNELKNVINSTLEEFDMGFNASINNYTIYYLDEYSFKMKNLINFIPIYIIIIQIIFMVWNDIAIHVTRFISKFCCCTTKSKNDNSNEHDHTYILNQQASNEVNKIRRRKLKKIIIEIIKNSFNITQNAEELFRIKKESDVHNNMGITYIKGIRSIAMIFLLVGNVFVNLFNSPMCIKDQDLLVKVLSSFFFSIVIIGIKFSPKVLLSCSGFELLYKFLCYLDDRKDDEKKRQSELTKNSKEKEDLPSNKTDGLYSQISCSTIDSAIKSKKHFKVKELMQIKYFYRFLIYQTHKYLMYILVINFIYFCLFYVVIILNDVKPLWIYFKEKIVNSISLIETFLSYILLRNIFAETENQDSIINVFSLVINEIIFFIISSIIIFVSYKYSFLLNRILLFLILGLFILRNVLYFIGLPQMNATNYFTYTHYGLFSTYSIYNYIYFVIGMFFSLINYSFQKGMNFSLAIKQEKPYLFPMIKFIIILKKEKGYKKQIIQYISFILLLLIPLIQFVILNILILENEKNALKRYFDNKFFGCLLMYDGDLFVFLLHIFCILSYIQGHNIIIEFLSGRIWNIFNKLYFSYIIYLNPLILYVLYQGETRISLTNNYVFLFSTICGFIIFILCSVTYILIELPYKKAIYLSLNLKTKIHDAFSLDGYQTDSTIIRDKIINENSFRLFSISDTE